MPSSSRASAAARRSVPPIRRLAALPLAAVLLASALSPVPHARADAQPGPDADECERRYNPQYAQAGKDVIWIPTSDPLVDRMLRMARTTANDVVIDLGAGDGKIAIAAARDFGARAYGIEYNPQMVDLARCKAEAAGVAARATFVQGDIFQTDFSHATVLTMYLLPELNVRLRPTILQMKAGTRVVSHSFTMGDWRADDTAQTPYGAAYLWIVPARVEGAWTFEGEGERFEVEFTQTYQELGGHLVRGTERQPLVRTRLRGEEIRFGFTDARGAGRTFSGTVQGDRIEIASHGLGPKRRYVGTRR